MYTGRYQEVSDESILRVRRQFTRGFTEHHQRLVDICIGRIKPPCLDEIRPLNLEQLEYDDLSMMKMMVEVEFAASLEKEMKGTEDATVGKQQEPHAYDVFLMETTIDRSDLRLAVCMPTRTNDLVWYNGLDLVWEMDPPHHKWRVASLSGTARIMAALCENPDHHPLMSAAMKRELIIHAVDDDDHEENSSVDLAAIQHLNESQRQAVRTVVSPTFDSGFFVIQGPPGTGKTTTLVAMISALLQKGEKVLVTAPSNAAVANIALKLWSSSRGIYSFEDILVFGENCDKTVHFLSPRHRGVKFSMLHKELEGTMGSAARDKKRREFLTWLKLDEDDDRTMADLSYLCPYIDTSTAEGREYYSGLVSRSSVVFSTLNSAGSLVLRNSFPASIILLDEGGQCPEAEFHIVTSYRSTVEKVCVIGDPRQLPSTVIEPKCKLAGYGKSWLEKVQLLYAEKVHLLDTQYRMDPAILKFPNREFYQNRILSGDNVLSRDPFVEKPVVFVDTDRRGHEEISNFSWQNLYEVTVIKYLLFNDPDIVRVLREKRNARVIIITPYKAQAKLLKEHINVPRVDIEIATVDSFQGQEGDIVIIATVRTHGVGFVDDSQRLNVALTRAKRILRIVGDAAFFDSISSKSSTLRKLASFARGNTVLETAVVRSISWSRPNWSLPTLWKPCMTQRFQHCLKQMTERDKNISLNTLFAIAQADEKALYAKIPPKQKPSWYISCLRDHKDRRIVWIAKQLDVQAIEAHFAGSYKECLRFTQTHHEVPEEACIAARGLSSLIERQGIHEGTICRPELFVAWRVTNTTQNIVYDGGVLPAGSVQLDSFQEKVACSSPPLIIESRSGTGKTLVLLQHAAYHSDLNDKRPACFMTVSQRLRNELEQRYKDIDQMENLRLPPTIFITFDQLLLELLNMRHILDFEDKARCTYVGFEGSKTSYERTVVEPHLVENEIGGVINGSLIAAKQNAPLSRDQYLEDLRSNIGYETEYDISLRNQVYDEYEKYVAWKRKTNKFDVGDMVLRLLEEEWEQHFASAYLDEIQDLSYATIYLICSIAGRDTLRWVCAGDPAQMISPGCSFTFDGLKQTLLAVESGIEKELSKVSHLLINYRTTKDVLHLANEVLAVARKEFPGSIPFARAEVAKKDLGLKVVLCEWNTALEQEVSLGINQAIVFSSPDAESLEKELTDWIGEHPFIVSSLQSKGLEFDDVIVAFDHDRKTWNMSGKREASLCMLRELYVAITRAQRRVIILVKKSVPEMQRFYERLECEFQIEGAELVLKSMDTVATAEQWLGQAEEFFGDENYEMAMRCFGLAGKKGWMHWSSGKGLEAKGSDTKAGEQFLHALESFAMEGDYGQVLEVSLALARPSIAEVSQWDKRHSDIVKEGLSRCPNHLKRFDLVRLALARSLWDEIFIDDLKDENLASLFLVYRKNEALKRLVKTAGDDDRSKIELVLPVLIGDLHLDRGNYSEAARIFLANKSSLSDAEEVTKLAMREAGKRQQELIGVVKCWENASRQQPRDPRVSLLLELFRSPRNMAGPRGLDSLRHLGRIIVLIAVDTASEDRTILYEFSRTDFQVEVTEALVTRFPGEPIKVVWWFLDRNDTELALDFVQKQLKGWKDSEILMLNEIFFAPIPAWLIEATKRRKLFPLSIVLILVSSSLTQGNRNEFLWNLAKVDRGFNLGDKQLAITAAWALNEIVLDAEDAKKKNGKKAMRNLIAPSQLLGNHLKVFSQQLLALWPNQGKSATRTGLVEERLTDEVCRSLLGVLLDQSSPEDVNDLVNHIRQLDSTAKTCIPILALYLKRNDHSAARSLTSSALQCKKVSDQDLFGVVCLWSSQVGTKSVADVLWHALLSSPEKQKEEIMDKLPSLVHMALRDKRIDMAWDITCVAGGKYARIRPRAIITILKAWNNYHWTCSDGKGRSMFHDSRSIMSFLRLIHAAVNPTSDDLQGQNIYQPGDENQCCWLSALLISFGPSLVGAVKLHFRQKETDDKCIIGSYDSLLAHHKELRLTIQHKAQVRVASSQKKNDKAQARVASAQKKNDNKPQARVASAAQKKNGKPLTLEQKMAQALIQGKTFKPSSSATTGHQVASNPTVTASSLFGGPPPRLTSTPGTTTSDWSDMGRTTTTTTTTITDLTYMVRADATRTATTNSSSASPTKQQQNEPKSQKKKKKNNKKKNKNKRK